MRLKNKTYNKSTMLVNVGRNSANHYGSVNTPVYRTSTVLFENIQLLRSSMVEKKQGVVYGRFGTPTTFSFEEAIANIEGEGQSVATSSGKAAIVASLLSFLESGDHLLMVDCVYGPTRTFATNILSKFGIKTTFFDPEIGTNIKNLIKKNTKLIYLESPGSLTFEIQDIKAISKIAKKFKIITIVDSTWATPIFFKPLKLGIDISIHAATKYIVGHSDAMLGVITTRPEIHKLVRSTAHALGASPGSDDLFLGLRGLRTLDIRLKKHQDNAKKLIEFLKSQPEVKNILYPAYTKSKGYNIWKKNYSGASGLFGVELKNYNQKLIDHFINTLDLFGIGYSWGGFESLIIQSQLKNIRSNNIWNDRVILRIHAGLENHNDLIADFKNALMVFKK